MAPNPRNNIHDDPYMSDTYRLPGPLGDGAEPSAHFDRECGSITFDSQGRIVSGGGYFYLDQHDRAVIPTARVERSTVASPAPGSATTTTTPP